MILKNNKRIDGCSDTVPIGTLNPFLGSTAPYGYLICQGQKVSKTTYKELYEMCGDTFGQSTDTEFYLPDLRGQTIAGYKEGDSTFGTLGGLIGSLTHLHDFSHTHDVPGAAHTHSTGNHTLTVNEIPSHSHMVYRGTNGSDYFGLTGKEPNGNTPYSVETTATGGSQPHNHGNTGSTTPPTTTTNSQSKTNTSSVSNVQPTIVLNWIVKAFQLMPNQSYVSTVSQDSNINTYSCNYINDNIDTSYIDIYNGDFNSLVASSANKIMNYCIKTDSLDNRPCPYWGWLSSYFMSDVTMKQIFISDVNTIYVRQKLNGNWLPWRSIGEDMYSTEELVIGTWIDGKPIYRRVFFNYFNDEYNNWYSIGNIANLKTVIKVAGMIKQKNDGNFIDFPRCSTFDNTSSDLYVNGSTGEVNVRIGKATGELYLIVEYTKTTDV